MFSSNRFPIALLIFGLPLFGGTAPGIKNFDQVDAHVYRGAQPNADGYHYLAGLGVKTVIDLREPGDRSKTEEHMVTGLGMKYINVPMSGLIAPSEAEITKILAVLEDGAGGPVFVHCMRGADRTGAVIAAYHIEHDKWDSAHALQDARAHRMSFFQLPRQNFIRNFQPHTLEAQGSPAVNTAAAGTPAGAGAGAVKN